jgi:hypothetical protein
VIHGDGREFRRITMDSEVMGGKLGIWGMRVSAGMIVEALAAGRTIDQSARQHVRRSHNPLLSWIPRKTNGELQFPGQRFFQRAV